jgi:hypothetical protein
LFGPSAIPGVMSVVACSASARNAPRWPVSSPAVPSTHGLSWLLATKGSKAPAFSALARQVSEPSAARAVGAR